MEIKCPDCGEPVGAEDLNCPHCGGALRAPEAKPPEGPQPWVCTNCGGQVPGDQAYCPNCGSGPWNEGSSSTGEKVILGCLFVIIGVPAGLFGACTGFFAIGGGMSGPFVALGLVGLGVFALLLWLWIRSLKR